MCNQSAVNWTQVLVSTLPALIALGGLLLVTWWNGQKAREAESSRHENALNQEQIRHANALAQAKAQRASDARVNLYAELAGAQLALTRAVNDFQLLWISETERVSAEVTARADEFAHVYRRAALFAGLPVVTQAETMWTSAHLAVGAAVSTMAEPQKRLQNVEKFVQQFDLADGALFDAMRDELGIES